LVTSMRTFPPKSPAFWRVLWTPDQGMAKTMT
jgi:hypothetical protein